MKLKRNILTAMILFPLACGNPLSSGIEKRVELVEVTGRLTWNKNSDSVYEPLPENDVFILSETDSIGVSKTDSIGVFSFRNLQPGKYSFVSFSIRNLGFYYGEKRATINVETKNIGGLKMEYVSSLIIFP